MQPNLKSRNAMSLAFSATLPLPSDLVSRIRDTSSPDEDGDSVFFDSYKGHKTLAVVNGIDKDAGEYEVEFTYVAKSGGRLPKRFPRVEQLVDILSCMREQVSFECRVAFAFGRSLRPKSIIGLPMKYIEAPDMPFDRIQGLHFVKLDNNETKYDVFLEAPTQGVLIGTVIFKHISAIDESLSHRILTEGESISNRFVFKEREDAGKTKQQNAHQDPGRGK